VTYEEAATLLVTEARRLGGDERGATLAILRHPDETKASRMTVEKLVGMTNAPRRATLLAPDLLGMRVSKLTSRSKRKR
jgi:hypothetical protein